MSEVNKITYGSWFIKNIVIVLKNYGQCLEGLWLLDIQEVHNGNAMGHYVSRDVMADLMCLVS